MSSLPQAQKYSTPTRAGPPLRATKIVRHVQGVPTTSVASASEANLEDRRGSPQLKTRDRSATEERHNSENLSESEWQRHSNEAWEENEQANEAIRATQRHLRALTDESHVAATNLEKINRKLELMRKEEESITTLRLERERNKYEEQRAERLQRAYDKQMQRLEDQRKQFRERVALEY